ncbi:Aquaporin transporter [Gracilaria domingensis]|nr:Aquaporin transporter [Gracilaria domingensis]
MSAQRKSVKLFLREYVAVVLWTFSVLWLFFLSDTEFLRSINPNLKRFPPSQLFLSALACVMGVWELFGLSFGSPVNPAITLSLFMSGKLAADDAFVMTVAQFLGHIFATLLVRRGAEMMFEGEALARFAPPQPHEGLSYVGAVAIEMGITFSMCVLALSLDSIFGKRAVIKKWSVMTSITIAMVAGAGEWTGACMNPAMSLALSLLHNLWKNQEIYWIGPISGALLAAGLHRWSLDDKHRVRRLIQRRSNRARSNTSPTSTSGHEKDE